jgi:hypothetical protein
MDYHSEKEEARFVQEVYAFLGVLDRRPWPVAVNDVVANVIQHGESISIELIPGARINTIRLTHLKESICLLDERFMRQCGDEGIDALSCDCVVSAIAQDAEALLLTIDELLPLLRSHQRGGSAEIVKGAVQSRMHEYD